MFTKNWEEEMILNLRLPLQKKEEGAAEVGREAMIEKKALSLLEFEVIIGDELSLYLTSSIYGLLLIHAAYGDCMFERTKMDMNLVALAWNNALKEIKRQYEEDKEKWGEILSQIKDGEFQPLLPLDFDVFLETYEKKLEGYKNKYEGSKFEPPKGRVKELVGRAYLGVDWQKAKSFLLDAVKENPEKLNSWEALGEAHMNQNPQELKEAEESFRKALHIIGEDSTDRSGGIFFKLYRALWAQGKQEEALDSLEKGVEGAPSDCLPELAIKAYEVKDIERSKIALIILCPSRAKEINGFQYGDIVFEKMVQALGMARGILQVANKAFVGEERS